MGFVKSSGPRNLHELWPRRPGGVCVHPLASISADHQMTGWHALAGAALQGSLSEHLRERAGKGGTRNLAKLRELIGSPRSLGLGVHRLQNGRQTRVRCRTEPSGWGRAAAQSRPKPECLQHVEQPVEHRLPSRLLVQHLPRQRQQCYHRDRSGRAQR